MVFLSTTAVSVAVASMVALRPVVSVTSAAVREASFRVIWASYCVNRTRPDRVLR